MQVMHDWATYGTARKLEKDIGDGFKFRGPGMYLTKTDTILIIPATKDALPWPKTWNEDDTFHLYCWNCPFSETAYAVFCLIPNRLDERD